MKWGRRTRTVYRALERLTIALGRPPCRAELTESIDEPWADSSQIGRALKRIQEAGLVKNVGGGHYILERTDDGRDVDYSVELGVETIIF